MLCKGNTITPGSIQVSYINDNHWITISTIDIITASHYDDTVFDSVNFTLGKNIIKVLIAILLKGPKKTITVKFANSNKQVRFDDCGIFTVAYVYSTMLAHGQNLYPYSYS